MNWVKKEVPARPREEPALAANEDAPPKPPEPAKENGSQEEARKNATVEYRYELETVREFAPDAICFAQSADEKWFAFGRNNGWIYISDATSGQRLMRLRLLDTGKLDAFDAAKLQEAPAKRKGSGLSG